MAMLAPAASAGDAAWDVYVSLAGRDRLRVAVPPWPRPWAARPRANRPGAAPRGAAPGEAVAGQRYLRGGREIAVGWSRYGDLVISDRAPRPVITEHGWAPAGRLQLRGRYIGPAAGFTGVVLQRHGSGEQHRVACKRDGERFTVEIDVDRMPSFGDLLPLRDGQLAPSCGRCRGCSGSGSGGRWHPDGCPGQRGHGRRFSHRSLYRA